MRSATLFVLLGAAIFVNGCGSSSSGTGTGGNGGGTAGTSGGTAGKGGTTGAGGTTGGGGTAGSGAAGVGGGAAGSGGGAGKGGAGGSAGGSTGTAGSNGGAAGGSAGSTGAGGAQACGTDPASETGAGCNTIATGGPCVTELVVTGPPPTAAGGTVVAGTYNLTSVSLYNTPDGSAPVASMGRRTLVISGVSGTSFTLDQIETSGAHTDRSHGTVAIAGTMATFTPTCPPPSDAGDNGGSVGFTTTATTITLVNSPKGDGSVEVDVYTKT
jgi:hypothetical protein